MRVESSGAARWHGSAAGPAQARRCRPGSA